MNQIKHFQFGFKTVGYDSVFLVQFSLILRFGSIFWFFCLFLILSTVINLDGILIRVDVTGRKESLCSLGEWKHGMTFVTKIEERK
jgi:hypothetical protein